ncbi:MAG: glycosyltransferase family 4 protein [Gammaproteobacteria bacterium]|nr:glycosyltransferase family 4 protein [Gammaproteobacteria bacterium]
MKILFITEDKFPPYRPDVAVLFVEELVARGYQIDWLLQAQDAQIGARTMALGGGTAWIARMDEGESRMAKFRKNVYDIANDFKMFKLARTGKYDFIQVKDKFVAALMALLAAKIYRLKFFYWLSFPIPEAMLYRVHEGISRYPLVVYLRGRILKFLLYRVIMPNADHVFVQSDRMKDDVAEWGIAKDKLTPVPMGVSLSRVPYNGETLINSSSRESGKMVVYLGALNRVRRIDFLIRAFGEVVGRVAGAKLCLVGAATEPGEENELKELAIELGIEDSTIFTGFLPMAEAWAYVGQADVAVSPFYPTPILCSTSPTKLVEYMAMGKPVVVNDHPDQKKVITESGGGICVTYDEHAFAAAIVELLNDPEQARIMGVRGRRYIEQHRSYTVLATQLDQRYRELCQNAQTRM